MRQWKNLQEEAKYRRHRMILAYAIKEISLELIKWYYCQQETFD